MQRDDAREALVETIVDLTGLAHKVVRDGRRLILTTLDGAIRIDTTDDA